jgi:cellulase
MVYIAPAKGNGKGAVWTKLYEDGYSNGKWGVDRFIANKGAITITLPDLADGTYLIRPEIIALHEANSRGGAQFYNRCGQIKIKGGSKSLPRTGTDLTKAYLATDPGVLCNIYYGLKSYQIPGPPVWDGAGSSTSPAAGTKPAASDSAAPTRTASVSKTRVSTTAKTGTTTSVSVIPTKTASVSKTPTPTAVKSDAAPSSCSESSADLPETFTITSFIAWLKKQTDTSGKVRHARAFRL